MRAAFHRCERLVPLRRIRGAAGVSDLGAEQGERCPQLVGGVGDEAALCCHLSRHPGHIGVESRDEGTQLALHGLIRQRGKIVAVLLHHRGAQAQQRRQSLSESQQDQQAGRGEQQELPAEAAAP